MTGDSPASSAYAIPAGNGQRGNRGCRKRVTPQGLAAIAQNVLSDRHDPLRAAVDGAAGGRATPQPDSPDWVLPAVRFRPYLDPAELCENPPIPNRTAQFDRIWDLVERPGSKPSGSTRRDIATSATCSDVQVRECGDSTRLHWPSRSPSGGTAELDLFRSIWIEVC